MTQNIALPRVPHISASGYYYGGLTHNTNVKTAWLEEQPRGNMMEYLQQLQLELQAAREAYQILMMKYVDLQDEFRAYKAALDRCEIPL